MILQKADSMDRLIVVTGFIALLLSIVMGVQFYSSLAHDALGKVTYISAGALLTCLVVLVLSLALYSFQRGMAIMGTLLTLMWALLISMEILAEFGFLATQQERKAQEVAKDSAQARLAENSVKGAQAKVEDFSKYANLDIDSINDKLSSLQTELTDANARLAACPANYKTNCINPAKASIAKLQGQIEPLQRQVDGYEKYQGAQVAVTNAGNALNTALSGKEIGLAMSPVYTWLSRLTGMAAENLQAGSSILIATILSIWASFAGFILLRFRQSNGSEQAMTVTDITPQKGGYMTHADFNTLLDAHLKQRELASPK
jgi:hypothetical protein